MAGDGGGWWVVAVFVYDGGYGEWSCVGGGRLWWCVVVCLLWVAGD